MLGEADDEGRIVICDLEAGVGPMARAGGTDVALVIAEPSVKSIDVARRAAAAAAAAEVEVIVVANRVRDGADLEAIRVTLGHHEMVVVPEDRAIARADEEGRAPIDVDPEARGVTVLLGLADRLGKRLAPV